MDTQSDSYIIDKALTSKIKRLEEQVLVLKAELESARIASVQNLLGPLRVRQAVLVYFGDKKTADFAAEIEEKLGFEVANAICRHLFNLNNAPIDTDQRETLLKAFHGGCCKW